MRTVGESGETLPGKDSAVTSDLSRVGLFQVSAYPIDIGHRLSKRNPLLQMSKCLKNLPLIAAVFPVPPTRLTQVDDWNKEFRRDKH